MLTDYHVHTEFSDDSVYPMEQAVKDAIKLGLADSMPSAELLRLYRDMGGEIITIGSDSHAPDHLGAYIRETKEYLAELGFRSFCTYDKMQPVFHQL